MQRKARKSDAGSSSTIANSTTNDSGILLSDSASENASIDSLEADITASVDQTPTQSPVKLRSLKRSASLSDAKSDKGKRSVVSRVRKKPRKEYICSVCSKQFLGSSDLRKHSRIHTDERPFACDKCPRRFRQSVSLKNHIASIHGTDKRFSCEQCKKSFPLKERLKLHMRIHSGEKPYSCSQCTKTFARGGTLRQHIFSHHGAKKFKCLECPASFTSLNNLRLHMKIHLNVLEKRLPVVPATAKGKEFHCKVCNKTLKGHLLQHMKSHENIRSHTCNICGLQFSQKSHLNVHQRMHSGERPYRCRVCWQAFGHSSVLRLHIRKHTGEKPFKCLVCSERGVAFSQLPHLKNHMKVIHGKDKPYMCEACQEFFKTKNELKIHMESDCIKTSPEDISNESPNDEEVILSRLRLLVAILIKRISSEERLKQLGFEKRLIDNVVISALKLAKRKFYEDETMNEVERFRLNIEEFLEWTIPENFMIKFREEKKSIDDLLEELATSFSKPSCDGVRPVDNVK